MTDMIRALINDSYYIYLPKHRADRPEWYTQEGWEKKRLASMYEQLNNLGSNFQEVLFYIGAEEGEMPALCQMWGAKVVMFEPNPKVWPNIKAIWEANGLEHPAGIFAGFASDVTKDAVKPVDFIDTMGIGSDGWPKCASDEVMGAHGFKELDKEADSYNQMKIDDYVMKTGIIPTAMSIDVEGSEGKVLRGAEKTLREHHPKIWLSGHPEFMHAYFGEYLRDLRNWITDMGYAEELLDYQHEAHLYYHL